jgi:cysteine-rich repeat protein
MLAGSCGLLTLLASPRIAAAACGDGTFEPESEECDDGNRTATDGCGPSCQIECTEVGAAATEHTCLHGSFGPFATLAAQSFPGFVFSEVSTPHTYFTIQLGGEQNVGHRAVVFAPTATGAFGIYMKTNFPLVLRDSSGSIMPPYLEHAISGCSVPDALLWVKTFKLLDESETYTLDIGPVDAPSVSFAIENLGGFSRQWYADKDGDGFGGTLVAESWCQAPLAYDFDGDDCNEQDPLVNPEAPEVCNGVDDNCDFTEDLELPNLCTTSASGSVCLAKANRLVCGCFTNAECATGATCDPQSKTCQEPLGEGGAPGNGSAGAVGDAGDAGAAGNSGAAGDSGAPIEPRGGSGRDGHGTAGLAHDDEPKAGSAGTASAGAGGRGPNGASGGGPSAPSAEDSGCRIGGTAPNRPGSLWAFLLGSALLWRARRRRL